ncbi:Ppx/GppA phosphatase family-domain-containing protein [Pilobolus umbonatus]|nr:Ppx/GppA phosphatase family-domain-containing protein [Pilobolus umbonatus]
MNSLDSPMKAPFGVVDMGSNGVRFGIVTSLARHLPVAYEERAPISLLEALGDDLCIPEDTIDQIITTFLRFKTICRNEGVEPTNVKVIATEATRIASNSKEFLRRIYEATGWTVIKLSKEEEAIISSMGIVGSFYNVNGLTMDLGGGSVELSYVTSSNLMGSFEEEEERRPRKKLRSGDKLKTSSHPVSLPYGAAILRKRLMNCSTKKQKRMLFDEIVEQMKVAKKTTDIPGHLSSDEGYTMYMSGGGFRAIGYLSMANRDMSKLDGQSEQTKKLLYPIPIISGYSMTGDELARLAHEYKDEDPEEMVNKLSVFRISKRRARMIPAICFLVSAIIKTIKIKEIYFSEGGARQGISYYMLPTSEQMKDPLIEGVKAYANPQQHALSSKEYDIILRVLKDAIPPLYLSSDHPLQLHRLIPAAVHLANLTTHYPKETRAFVAFHLPLAGGPLANLPGLLHSERAILALILAYRQGGEVPDPAFNAIENMIGDHGVSVCKYIGRLMEILFLISPRLPGTGLLESGLRFRLVPNSRVTSSRSPSPIPGVESPYHHHNLHIIIPFKPSPMLEAPAVISVLERMDKKIQHKKFEMDDEAVGAGAFKLFSVSIIRE